jgi:hypothetical protein
MLTFCFRIISIGCAIALAFAGYNANAAVSQGLTVDFDAFNTTEYRKRIKLKGVGKAGRRKMPRTRRHGKGGR